MKITDLVAFAKAGYTPSEVKQIKEYTDTVEKPEDILSFVKAGWKPDDIKTLITEQKPDDGGGKDPDKTPKDPLEELKEMLAKSGGDK